MAAQLRPVVMTAVGYFGLNTQDSPTDIDTKFALDATNCVIDRSGRIASRKGWTAENSTSADLGTSNVEAIGELITIGGTSYIVCAGNNKLFLLSGGALTTLTYGGGGVAPTITASDWQMSTLNNAMTLFQEGHDPLIFDTALSTTTYRRLSEHPSYTGTAPLANCCISAFGRLWAASTTTDKSTVKWTDTGTHQKWSGGSSGSLDLTTVWPVGTDEIVGLAAHNNNLVIFGRRQILIYTGALTPSTMTLADSIVNIGCVARDSIQNTGEDIVFLSTSGIRTVARTIQEKSAPLATMSRNVNDDVVAYSSSSTNVKAIYSPQDAFYLIAFVDSGVCYCFDMRATLQDGSARATYWTGIEPKALAVTKSRELLIGKAGYVGLYDGYTDNGDSYRMSYRTVWSDLGDPLKLAFLKKIKAVVIGAQNQSIVVKWGFDYTSDYAGQSFTIPTGTVAEYGSAEYGISEYNSTTLTTTIECSGTGGGKLVQVGIEANPASYSISIQKIEIYVTEGRM